MVVRLEAEVDSLVWSFEELKLPKVVAVETISGGGGLRTRSAVMSFCDFYQKNVAHESGKAAQSSHCCKVTWRKVDHAISYTKSC